MNYVSVGGRKEVVDEDSAGGRERSHDGFDTLGADGAHNGPAFFDRHKKIKLL